MSEFDWRSPGAYQRAIRSGEVADFAWESLRRDVHGRTLLDLSSTSWNGLLRAVLGNPEPEVARTTAGRGILLRLLIGEPLRSLLTDDDLVLAVSLSAPVEKARQ